MRHLRPVCSHAMRVVPVPPNRSRTVSPGSVNVCTISSGRYRGNVALCMSENSLPPALGPSITPR